MNTIKMRQVASYILMCFLIQLFISCEELNGSNTDYQKACEELDYNKAWSIVGKLKEQYDKAYADCFADNVFSSESNYENTRKKFETAFDYVLRSEANYLITNGDEASAKRVVVLLNEQKIDEYEKNLYINDFTNLAISLDNDYILDLFAKNATLENEILIEYLAKKNDSESSNQVVSILSREFRNCKKPNPGLNDAYCMDESLPQYRDEYNWSKFNNLLNKYLNIAIANHNKYLAEKTLGLYTQTAVKIEPDNVMGKGWYKKYKGVEIDGNHCYIEFNNSEKDEARRNYNDALKSGAFN